MVDGTGQTQDEYWKGREDELTDGYNQDASFYLGGIEYDSKEEAAEDLGLSVQAIEEIHGTPVEDELEEDRETSEEERQRYFSEQYGVTDAKRVRHRGDF